MSKFFHTKWFDRDWHPSEEDILLYVDGELEVRKSTAVRSHLETCWTCRARTEELQETISSFIQYLDKTLTPSLDPPPHRWQTFLTGLRSANKPRSTLMSRFFIPIRSSFRMYRSVWALGVLFLIVVSALIVRFQRIPPVSASQLLKNANEAQARRMRDVPQPVIYHKLNVRRKSSIPLAESHFTWEIWNNPSQQRLFQRFRNSDGVVCLESGSEGVLTPSPSAKSRQDAHHSNRRDTAAPHENSGAVPEDVGELQQVYRTNAMDFTMPLSPAAYRLWRASVKPKSEEVKEVHLPERGKSYALLTAFGQEVPDNGLLQAEFYVRARDWHPFEQRLTVRAAQGQIHEFQISEADFEVLALGTLPPFVFQDQGTAVITPEAPFDSVPPRQSDSGGIDSEPREIEALYVLHEMKACLGEPVQVVSSSGQVYVRGVVDTAQRKEELVTAFRAHPRISVDLRTPSEVLGSVAETPLDGTSSRTDARPSEETLIQVRSGQFPVRKELTAYLAAQSVGTSQPMHGALNGMDARSKEFLNEVIALSQATMDEAWALRRLNERYSAHERQKQDAPLKWLLNKMIQDHSSSLRHQLTRFGVLLKPFLSQLLAKEAPLTTTGADSLPEAGETDSNKKRECLADIPNLFKSVESIERLTRTLFGSEETVLESPREMAESLLFQLDLLECQLRNIEEQIDLESLEKTPRFTFYQQ